jgi:hypothetical protein
MSRDYHKDNDIYGALEGMIIEVIGTIVLEWIHGNLWNPRKIGFAMDGAHEWASAGEHPATGGLVCLSHRGLSPKYAPGLEGGLGGI